MAYETDNFAFIINERRRRQEEIEARYRRWEERAEAERRALPWCWAISIGFAVIIWAICYFNG